MLSAIKKFLKSVLYDPDTDNTASIDDDGQLHVVMEGKADPNNSTTTPLGIGAVFTGTATNILAYSGIAILVGSDVAGTLALQYSPDGSDWHAGEEYDILAGANKFFTPPVQSSYYRIVYTNGAVGQTTFYIHPTLKKQPIKWSSHNIEDPIVDEDDAELVKAVITGKKASGVYDNVSLTNGGNMKASIEELESGISSNSNSQLNVTQFDSSGNEIDTHEQSDGGYHLGTSITQSILTSSSNSTTTNLASAATFTGVAEETFGINGIQVYHFADQDCTVYVDQSINSTNWDIVDSFPALADEGYARTFVSVAPYFRIRVTNTGDSTTTEIRTAAGMTPVITPLPRALSPDNRLLNESTLTGQQNPERHVWVTPTNSLSVESPARLVGTNYDGQTKDPNFWTEATTGSGTVTQDGEIQLDTGTTANSTASYTSVRKARFVVGSALKFQGLFKFVTTGTTDNLRRCGAYLATDGFFFQLDGTTFSIGHRKNSTDTLVNTGSFNGNIGPYFTPEVTSYYKFEIEWTPKGTFWYIDGVLLHKLGVGHLSDILTLPIAYENVNDNGSIVDVAFDCLGAVIVRLGDLITNSTYKYISGAATTICKYGAGTLHTVINNDNTGSCIIYDNTSAAAPIMASMDLVKVLGTQTFNAPFSNGLTVVTTGAVKLTVVYE